MHSIRSSRDSRSSVEYDFHPDFCPVCHFSAVIILISTEAHIFPPDGSDCGEKMQLLFRCPRNTCGTHFLVEYWKVQGGSWYSAKNIYPKIHKDAPVANGILDISPRFVKILQQATKADSQNLEEVSGIAYRKALEFLIKDYCIHKSPAKASDIRTSKLAQCITSFISDANIKECAKRAAWLGNDEAHYERVWTSHDIGDLKTLIQLTQNWIANELLTAKYLEELDIPNAKGKT